MPAPTTLDATPSAPQRRCMPTINYYELLGVPTIATAREIEAAFKRLARKYHPKLNPGDQAAELTYRQLCTAFRVLKDPQLRRQYDQRLKSATPASPTPPPPKPVTRNLEPAPAAARLELNAATLFRNAQTLVRRTDWRAAADQLDRLEADFSATRFYAANRAAIDALRAKVEANLPPKPAARVPAPPKPTTRAPTPPKPPVKPKPPPDAEGWISLFDAKSLAGWRIRGRGASAWRVEGGALASPRPSDDIITTEAFEDFQLHIEFKVSPGGNSGVYLRGRVEVQVLDSYGKPDSGLTDIDCGGIYKLHRPRTNAAKPAGEWNTFDITMVGQKVTVVLNGKTVVDGKTCRPTASPLDSRAGEPGPIMLQAQHAAVWYRNIRLRRLKPEPGPVAEQWISLFDGKTLAGWKHAGGKAYVEDGALVSENGADLLYDADWSAVVVECELKGRTTKGTAVCCLQIGHKGMGRGNHRMRIMFHRTGEVEVQAHDASRLWKSRAGRFPVNDWLRLSVQMTRDKLTLSRGGQEVHSLDTSAVPLRKGGLYFFSFGGASARLRKVRVRLVKHERATVPPPPDPPEAEDPKQRAVAAYAGPSNNLWALFGQREVAAAEKTIARLAADPAFKLAAGHVRADAEASTLLGEFWALVEKKLSTMKGDFLLIGGVGGKIEGVKDGVVSIRTPDGTLERRKVTDLGAKQAAHYSGLKLKGDARSKLMLGVFLLADGTALDDASKALAKAGDAPAVAIYRERLAVVTTRAQGAAARDAWSRIEDAAKGKLTRATAQRLAESLRHFEKAHSRTKLYASVAKSLEALRTRIVDTTGRYTKWPFDAAEAKRRQLATARALGVKVEQDIVLGKGIKLTLVLIPAGEFLMGSPEKPTIDELIKAYGGKVEEYEREQPQHRVRINRPFWLGKYEVTQEQWQAAMGTNPSKFKGPENPVEMVSWDHCQAFLAKLNEKVPRAKLRFPTEAEWEYACRAGTATQFCFGDAKAKLGHYAWFNDNSGGTTHPVGRTRPNAWGLCDMHGNVREWCGDWYEQYRNGAQVDPKGPGVGGARVLRAGSWLSYAHYCRSASRLNLAPVLRNSCRGFRVARSLP